MSFALMVSAAENIETSLTSSYHYDSNVFRLADEDEARQLLGDTQMSDRYRLLAAKIKAKLPISRQTFNLNADIQDVSFERFDYLDYTGGTGDLGWNWQLGNNWNGEISVDYSRTNPKYEDSRFVMRDILTKQGGRVSLQHTPNPDLHGKITYIWKDIDHTADVQKTSNRQVRMVHSEFRFFSKARTYFGVRFGYTDVQFPDRQVLENSTTDDGFNDISLDMTLQINPSIKTTLEGRAGFAYRAYNNLTEENVFGVTGNFKHIWRATEKFQLTSSIWRDFDPISDGFANQLIKTGLKFEPQWKITSRILMQLFAQYEFRDYKNIEANTRTSREDNTFSLQSSLSYLFLRNVQAGIALQTEDRNSSLSKWGYRYYYAMVNLSLVF